MFLAIAHRELVRQRGIAELAYVTNESSKTVALKEDLVGHSNTRDIRLTNIDGLRRIDKADHTRTLEIANATAEKTYSHAIVVLDNTAQAHVDREAAIKKANQDWQKAENKGRERYTAGTTASFSNNTSPADGLAEIERVYAEDVARHQKTYADEIAGLAKTRDSMFTTHQITAWSSEVNYRNTNRTSKGSADLAFWNAREQWRLVAHQFIHANYATPNGTEWGLWANYLVAAANARVAAFNLITPHFTNLITSRNTSESTHQSELSAAYKVREDALTNARHLHALGTSKAAMELVVGRARIPASGSTPEVPAVPGRAEAEANYLKSIAPDAREFLDKRAENPTTSTSDVDANKFYADEAEAFAARWVQMVESEKAFNVAILNVDKFLADAKANNEKTYRHKESDAYLASITRWANLDAAFSIAHAQGMASAAMSAQNSTPSPWLLFDTLDFAAQSAYANVMEPKKATKAI